jgi:DNA-binding beta-propeller fold protein YncE
MKKTALSASALALFSLAMVVPSVIAGLEQLYSTTTPSYSVSSFGGSRTASSSFGSLEVVANITLDKEPKCIAVNEETNRVYVGADGGLVIIDGETDEVLTEILSDTEVVALAVNPQTNRIYAALYGENVTVINGATNQIVGGILERVYNQYEIAVNPATNLVYIADWTTILGEYDRVRVYHGENLTLTETVNIPGSN